MLAAGLVGGSGRLVLSCCSGGFRRIFDVHVSIDTLHSTELEKALGHGN